MSLLWPAHFSIIPFSLPIRDAIYHLASYVFTTSFTLLFPSFQNEQEKWCWKGANCRKESGKVVIFPFGPFILICLSPPLPWVPIFIRSLLYSIPVANIISLVLSSPINLSSFQGEYHYSLQWFYLFSTQYIIILFSSYFQQRFFSFSVDQDGVSRYHYFAHFSVMSLHYDLVRNPCT